MVAAASLGHVLTRSGSGWFGPAGGIPLGGREKPHGTNAGAGRGVD